MNEKNGMDWDGDVTETAKIEAEIETAKTAKQMMEELWDAEMNKSAEEAVHDNMNPQRWA